MISADNQQERLNAKWITGFVDGEGCFHVSINKLHGMTLGWQVLPEFRVVQHERDEIILQKLKLYFGFGKIVVNHDDRKEFRVRGLENLKRLIKFFKRNPLQTSKRKNFEIFSGIIAIMDKKQHLTQKGLRRIANLASKMNQKIKRHLESSETTRPTSTDG